MAAPSPTLRVQTLIDGLGWGGAEGLLADLALAAPGAGLELAVAYLRDRDGSPAARRLRAAGIEPVLLGTGRLTDPRSFAAVRRHLRLARPDVVHTHLDASDVLGGLAARSLGLPVVSTVHLAAPAVSDDPGLRGALKRGLTLTARAACDQRVVCVSDAARTAYLHRVAVGGARVRTVRNGIVPPEPERSRAEVRAELGVATEAVVVVMTAVLREGKGHQVAIDAVALLCARHPELVLLITGDGPSRADITRLAVALGERAVMTGHRDDVADVLAASDIVLHPTRMDAFPTSLIEAAAAGLPAVATAVGGVPEIVRDGITGILIAAPTTEAVTTALGQLLDDPERRRRLGRAARVRYGAELTADAWALRLRVIYEGCL